ncbi:uncharacterized protein LOC132257626 [Phlebotomus argentipes]|uniref:uncharacterized protein LOC132257626 n=1 Tax=Phlebotomus argentipes TaxID=94469 RepID=UPI0028931072|nr:uncharacterized protein LOC132257626 [Phlebotomus argentipes]
MQTLGKVIVPLVLFVFIRENIAAPTPGVESDSPLQVITILSPESARDVTHRTDRKFREEDLPPEKDSSEIVVIQPLASGYHPQDRHLRMLGVSPRVPVHFAPGAYPIFYTLARANGAFTGRNIRALPKDEIDNYLHS